MNLDTLTWLISAGFAATVVFISNALLGAFFNSTATIKEQQISSGDRSLSEVYLSLSPEVFFLLRIAAFVLAFFLGFLIAGPVLGIIFGTLCFYAPLLALKVIKSKRVRKVELQLIEGLELLGNSLKSGLTLAQATELLVKEFPPPLSQEFALVLAEARLGVDFTDALENMATRLGSTIVHILSTGVVITKRCGGDLSEIFANIAQTIRERATIEGKLEAVTAQARFQGLILGLMPFALIVALYFIDRQHVVTLFSYKMGVWAFSLVCLMVVMAQAWIQKLLQIDV